MNYVGGILPTGNQWIGNSSGPLPLAQGISIDSSPSLGSFNSASGSGFGSFIAANLDIYVNFPGLIYSGSTSYGNFTAGQEGIIGMKFKIGNDTHYGWARVEVTSGYDTLIIKDYAYEATANASILAGDTASTSVGVQALDNNVLISNYNNNVQVKLNGKFKNAQLTITNISGQQILSKELNSDNEIITMDEFAGGIYMARVTSDECTITKRVYIR